MTVALRNIPEPRRGGIAVKRAGLNTKGLGQAGARDYLAAVERKLKVKNLQSDVEATAV